MKHRLMRFSEEVVVASSRDDINQENINEEISERLLIIKVRES